MKRLTELIELLLKIRFTSYFAAFGMRGCSAAGTLVLNFYLAKRLNPDDFGQFTLGFTGLLVLTILSRCGLDTTMSRFGGAAWFNGRHLEFASYSFFTTRLIGLLGLVAVIVGVLGQVVTNASYLPWSIAAWFLVAIVPFALLFNFSLILKAAGRPGLGSGFEVGIVSLLTTIILVTMDLSGKEISVVVASRVLAVASIITVASVLAAIHIVRVPVWGGPNLSRKQTSEFLWTATDLGLVAILHTLSCQGAAFFLAASWSNYQIGGFAVAMRLVSITVVLRNVVIYVVNPRLAGLYDAKAKEEFGQLASRSATLVTSVCSMPLLPMLIAPKWTMSWIGEDYVQFWMLLPVLAVTQIFYTAVSLAPSVLAMAGRQKLLRYATIVCSAISLPICGLLVLYMGALGAALGTSFYLLAFGCSCVGLSWFALSVSALPGWFVARPHVVDSAPRTLRVSE